MKKPNIDASTLACSNCGTTSPTLETLQRKKGCLRSLLETAFYFIPIIGWGMLIYWGITDGKTYLGATCQKCGNHWDVKKPNRKIKK